MSRSFKRVAMYFILAVALVIARAPQAFASQEVPHRIKMSSEGDSSAAEAAPAETPAQVWQKIRAKRDAIKQLIDGGSLDEIHAATEKLPALGEALLSVSAGLEGSKRARVAAAVKQLPRATDRLHDAADTGDARRTAGEFKKLDGLLDLIAAQYPHGVLVASEESRSHHASGEVAAKPSEHDH